MESIVLGAWERHANCLGLDPEVFFPEPGHSSAPAKAVCAGCEVRTECLEEALQANYPAGIWGGLTPAERRLVRRGRRRHLAVVSA